MNVLVTGSTGCLGKLVAAQLRNRKSVTVWTSSRGAIHDDFHIECDLVDASAIDELVGKVRPDLIFHLAASYTGEYVKDLAVNTDSARHLLDAALRRNLRPRTVLIGSAAEYGMVEPDDNPVTEAQALRPVSVYGVTKAFQTLLSGHYAYQHGMDIVVARLFNLFATEQSERLFVGRVERLIEQFKRGQRDAIEIGNLSAQRDYVDSVEAVEQLVMIATRGSPGEVYNLGSGRPTSMRDLLARMLSDSGLDMSVVREGSPAAGRAGYDVPIIYADTRKTLRLRESNSRIPGWR